MSNGPPIDVDFRRMLPGMTGKQVPQPGRWVKVKLPSGQKAMVTTKFDHGHRLVIVKPIREEN